MSRPNLVANLATFVPADQEAFALAGMALLDAINDGALIVADQKKGPRADYAANLVGILYEMQEAIHSGQHDDLKGVVVKLCALDGRTASERGGRLNFEGSQS